MIGENLTKFTFRDLFVFRGFKFAGSWITNGQILVKLRRTSKTGKCPKCKKFKRKPIEKFTRRIRDLDIGGVMCFIEIEVYRISCSCGFRSMEELEFAGKYARFTRRFEEKVAVLCRAMTIKDAAQEMRIGWETAKNIDKEEAKKYVVALSEVSPKRIGIDEIAYEKGHKYLTVVRDVDLRKVIWIGIKRQKETLDKFFQELGEEKSRQISLVAIDMWDPFIASVKEHTNAEIVFDKFHVAKHVNEELDNVRKKEFAKADYRERSLMKHKRFLILSRKKNLDRTKKESLKNLMKKNDTLYKAYLLKEQILDIMDEPMEKKANKRFAKWFDNIAIAKIPEFDKVARMLERYSYGIVNYFKHRITNAASEGFNTKINVIKRRAYGFRDLEYFMLKIIQLCGISSRNP